MSQNNQNTIYTVATIIIALAILGFVLWGIPKYKVYKLELNGQAQLKEAKWNRQIKIEEAQANLEAEKLNAQAEIERAKGVAQANQIVGQGLKNNTEYIKYLWVKGLTDGSSEVIYVPTESNLPILEAGRLN